MEQSDILCSESFFGVNKFLKEDDNEDRARSPLIFVIKNIKMIPQTVLNDLIHLFKKYRGTPYNLKLNLMIGVQNNNIDEFQMRVKIQNAVKMTVKKFYFPCMKNIIFEVINELIMNPSPITFGHDVVQNIIEIINLNGMSINKFKRILRILLTDFFYYNEFFYIHSTEIGLFSHSEFMKQLNNQLMDNIKTKITQYYKDEAQFKELFNELGLTPQENNIQNIEIIRD